jgi:hypothetical protein
MYDTQFSLSLARRGSAPVQNRRVASFVLGITAKEIMAKGDGNPRLRQDFAAASIDWLGRSTAATLSGLDNYPVRYFVNGVTQGYDLFFYEHKECRFRTYGGEYRYTRLAVQNWLPLEEDDIRAGDALTITLPFYINGAAPPDLSTVLDRCADLSVPVFIDAAYFGTVYDTQLDYSHPAIEMVGVSLSKTFSIQSYRVGLLLTK